MRIKPKESRLGTILEVVELELRDNQLVMKVDHSKTHANIVTDDQSQMISSAFLFVVKLFLKNNDIDFNPTGEFMSRVWGDYWYFIIDGGPEDPMEYLIKNLN